MKRFSTVGRAIEITVWSIIVFLLLPSLIALPIAIDNVTAIVFPPRQFGIALLQAFFTEPGWVEET